MLFDACVAIDQGGCGGISRGWGLTWERAYTSDDKYMCQETTLGHVMMWALIIVLTGFGFYGLHGKGQNKWPLLHTLVNLPLTAFQAPITL
jgi:hypothetical protein